MICSVCEEEMSPLKGSICASGINTCCVPCWSCHNCGVVSYLQDEKEFDLWIREYTEGINVDPCEEFGLLAEVDEESLRIIDEDD